MEGTSIEERTLDLFGIGMGQPSCFGVIQIRFTYPMWFEEIVVSDITQESLEITVRFTREAGCLALPVGEVVA